MQDYFMLFGRHQKETILNLIPVPDQDKHVFCRVLADRGYVEMNNAG
jgi:hypothetical protein